MPPTSAVQASEILQRTCDCLIHHNSLEETEMIEFNVCSDSWVQKAVDAMEHYDVEKLQRMLRGMRRGMWQV
jgi:hypothetical protein